MATTHSDHDHPIFSNRSSKLLPDVPNQLWVADITYAAVAVGFVYVAIILDAWSRKVLGYTISRSIDARLAISALEIVVDRCADAFTVPIAGRNTLASPTGRSWNARPGGFDGTPR